MARTSPTSSPVLGLALAWACVVLPAAAAADEPGPIRFSTEFEGGSLGTIERVGDGAYRLRVAGQQDEHGRNRQPSWYSCRMDGVRGRDLALTLTDFVGEYNGRPGACPMGPEIVPVYSEDGEHWRGVPEVAWDDSSLLKYPYEPETPPVFQAFLGSRNGRKLIFQQADRAKEATIRLRPEGDTLWVAHQEPYTPRRLVRLLERVDRCTDARVEVIGKTVRGRDLHLVTVTDAGVPDRDKVTVWLQARQHAWESGTSFVMEGALLWATSDDPDARSLRRRVVFVFTPMVDPDGSAAGAVRYNARGYDVNRHWDEVDLRDKRFLALMPEIWYVKKAILARAAAGPRVRLLLNLHNTETAEYLATAADDEASRGVVMELSDRLVREAGFRPSRGPTFGGSGGGTTNVLYAGAGIPVVLMEQRIGKGPETGRPPTSEDRLAFGAKLIRFMAEAALR